MISYSGLSPVDSSVTHSHLLTPHEMEWGREQEWYKWDKYFLIGNIKVMYTSKRKQGIHSPLPMGRLLFSPPQESRAPSHITVTWDSKCHHSKCLLFLLLPPTFIVDCDFVWCGMSLGSAVPAVSLPSFLYIPSLLTGGVVWEVETSLLLYKHYLTRLKHPCVISTV